MPENIRTNLEIRADARQVDTLTGKFKQLFSPKTPRGFNSELVKVNRALEAQKRHIANVAQAMTQVDRESKVWKRLNQDLRDSTRSARDLQRALDAVAGSTARTRGAGPRGGGGGPGGVPVGPGARLSGLQLAMPGQAAMTSALAAAPVVGTVAAGSLMAATSTYGSYMQLAQARMQATPYLQSSANLLAYRRAQTQGRSAAVQPHAATTAQIEAQQQVRTQVGMKATAELAAGMFDLPAGADPAQYGGATMQGVRGWMQQRIRRQWAKSAARLEAGEGGYLDEVRGWIAGKTVGAGETFAPAATQRAVAAGGRAAGVTTEETKAAARQQQAVSKPPVDFKAYERIGRRFGVAPAQAIQMSGQFGQAAGFAPSEGNIEAAMAMQRVFGMGMGQTGRMARALQQTGMRGEDTTQAIADMIEQGLAEGLNGSDLLQELEAQTAFMEEQSRKGIDINAESLLAQRGRLAGLRGPGGEMVREELIGELGRGFSRRAQQMGTQGGDEAIQARLARAWAKQRGISMDEMSGETWSQFLLDIQDPSKAQALLPGFMEQFQGIGRGEAEQQIFTQRAAAAMGMNVGPGETLRALSFGQFGGAGAARGDVAGMIEAGQALTPGVLKAQAGIEAEKAATGAQIAGTVQNFQRIQNDMARAATAFEQPLTRVTGQMHKFAEGLANTLEVMMKGGLIDELER